MRQLDLDKLKLGQPGLTPNAAAFLVEAAVFCLMMNGYESGTVLKVVGDFEENVELIWTDELTDQMRRTWNDQKEVTEYGATAIAALLLDVLVDYEMIVRTEQGGGVDYKIGKIGSLEIEAHLEVSGIWNRTPKNTVNVRVNEKIQRLRNKRNPVAVYIIVTEFSLPKSKIIKYDGRNQTNT